MNAEWRSLTGAVPMVTMVPSDSGLSQHARSHGSHVLTHTPTSTQLQPRGAKRQFSYYLGSFRISVIHGTLTYWTT